MERLSLPGTSPGVPDTSSGDTVKIDDWLLEILACQLPPDELGVGGQKQDSAVEPHLVRQTMDGTGFERIKHSGRLG